MYEAMPSPSRLKGSPQAVGKKPAHVQQGHSSNRTLHAPKAFTLLLWLALGEPFLSRVGVPWSLKWVQWQENTDKLESPTPFRGGRRGFCSSHGTHQRTLIEHLRVPDMAFGSLQAVLCRHRGESRTGVGQLQEGKPQ